MLRLFHNRECVDEIKLEESKHVYTIEFPWEKYTEGVFWFSLVPDEKCKMQQISGYYMGCVRRLHMWQSGLISVHIAEKNMSCAT